MQLEKLVLRDSNLLKSNDGQFLVNLVCCQRTQLALLASLAITVAKKLSFHICHKWVTRIVITLSVVTLCTSRVDSAHIQQ